MQLVQHENRAKLAQKIGEIILVANEAENLLGCMVTALSADLEYLETVSPHVTYPYFNPLGPTKRRGASHKLVKDAIAKHCSEYRCRANLDELFRNVESAEVGTFRFRNLCAHGVWRDAENPPGAFEVFDFGNAAYEDPDLVADLFDQPAMHPDRYRRVSFNDFDVARRELLILSANTADLIETVASERTEHLDQGQNGWIAY